MFQKSNLIIYLKWKLLVTKLVTEHQVETNLNSNN
jgi:hypothetical protein